jgi:3-oxoacyl-[acyl-carrier protein] reductase
LHQRQAKADEVVAEIEKSGGKAVALKADVTNEAQIAVMVNELISRYGKIDILVNNAGILIQGKLIDTPKETIRKMFDVDLMGVFLVTRAVLPHMLKANYGRIVNIAFQLGQKGGNELSAYCASKGGVIAFTKSMAIELGNMGMKTSILVNCVCPGPIETDLIDGLSPEWKKAKANELPLGRFGTPEEVAPSILFLSGDECGLFVGQVLSPNSGDTMVG